MRGENPEKAVKRLAKRMNVSKSNARRLLFTENAYISNKAMADAYVHGTFEKYELLATLDLKTSTICQHMDGKKFFLKDRKEGINFPPFHPNCRTIAMPCYDDDIERRLDERAGRVARNPETGKTENVPNLKYSEWYKKYVKDSDLGYNINISGAITDIYSKPARNHAELYYEQIRKQKTDINRISTNTGYSENAIKEIKNYLFYDIHNLNGNKRRFDPDFAIAQSWQRLAQGDIKPHDMILLKHEIMEKNLIKQGYSQDEAHKITSKKYNYDKEAKEYYDTIKKRKKRK